MGIFKKRATTTALALGLSLYFQGASFPQSLDGGYKAILNCAKLPYTDAPLDNEPVDLTISNGKATYSRTLYGANRKTVVGQETGTGNVTADGTIVLTGGWTGKRDTLKASYKGKLAAGGTVLTGKHIVMYKGQSYDRSCTLTVKN